MDEVICDFLSELCRRYNLLYGVNLQVKDINHYDLSNFMGEDGSALYLRSGFFNVLKPFPGAVEVISLLYSEGHDLIIATNALGNVEVTREKRSWCQKHLPFLHPDRIIITAQKHLLEADVIFEDSPEVLNRFNGIKAVMDRPYNQGVEGYRIFNNNWREFYNFINKLSGNDP